MIDDFVDMVGDIAESTSSNRGCLRLIVIMAVCVVVGYLIWRFVI